LNECEISHKHYIIDSLYGSSFPFCLIEDYDLLDMTDVLTYPTSKKAPNNEVQKVNMNSFII